MARCPIPEILGAIPFDRTFLHDKILAGAATNQKRSFLTDWQGSKVKCRLNTMR